CRDRGARSRLEGRSRARGPAAAESASRRSLRRGQEARARPGVRLPPERPRRLRGRLPAGRAQGPHVLRARGRSLRLHTYEWGDPESPLVVCLHGVTGHGLRFRKLAEERLANRFRVVAADLRGHGHSTWDEPWSIAAHVEDLLETFDEPAD